MEAFFLIDFPKVTRGVTISKSVITQKNHYGFTKHGHVAYQINQLDETIPESDTRFFLKGQLFAKNEVKGQKCQFHPNLMM